MSVKNVLELHKINGKETIYNKLGNFTNSPEESELTKKYYGGDEDILFTSNPKYIKKDILFFKDEVLKEIKLFQSKINEKTKDDEKYIKDKLEKFSIQIGIFGEKIIELSKLISTDKEIRNKVETIMEFKNRAQEIIMTNEIKIENIDKDLHNNIFRIDNLLKDTVIYPGLIGGIAKFKTFHDFIDYVMKELSQGITFREKNTLDLNNYKTKLDNVIHNFMTKIDSFTKSSQSYSEKCVENLENKLNSIFDLYNEKLTSLRIENASYSEGIQKMAEDLLNQINNVFMIKKELLNKFEEQMNFIKKDNARVIKCFSWYKEQFYDMKRKFIEMSGFLGDGRFKKNMGDEFNRMNFNNTSKKIGDFRGNRWPTGNKEKNLEKINNRMRRGSAQILLSKNILFLKDNNNKEEHDIHFSDKEIDKVLTKEERVYEKFLREYKKLDSEKINKNNGDKKNGENNNESNLKDKLSKKNANKNKKHHHHHHQRHRHHRHKNHNKNEINNINNVDIIYNEKGDFIQRRKRKFCTISQLNNKLNFPLVKLFHINNGNNSNNNKTKENKKMKRLKTQKINKKGNLNKIRKLDKINTSYHSNLNSSYSNSSLSRTSSSSSCSSCSNSSSSNSSSSGSNGKVFNKKSEDKKNNIIKEVEENSNKNSNKSINKNNNNISEEKNEIQDNKNLDITNNPSLNIKEDKEVQSENGSLQKEKTTNLKLNLKPLTNSSISKQKNNILLFKTENKYLLNNKTIKEETHNKEANPYLIVTNYKDKKNQFTQCYSNSYQNYKSKNSLPFDSLKKISITVEGSNKIVIDPKLPENKMEKNVIENVKTIINNKKKSGYMPNKTYNGFPKIVTNKGEQIIFASHPVFHSKKFVNYISPNVLALNHSIQTLYGNKFKKIKMTKSKNKNFNNNINKSDINMQKINESDYKKYYAKDEGFNTDRPSFNDIFKNNILITLPNYNNLKK